jgi:preprotein translocase subunit YajC
MYHENKQNQGLQTILWLIVIMVVFLIRLLIP